ncbi:DUF4168 domain-containing protein [Pontibacter diazotrophicus]|uniref:DUF4168 domain-containing protein n=1 Tax=Pontibacter diazotrophicus TaxID=1400979 RepID=A0A3D8LF62_9BACT|nr:DUF4168 domain-containing protein [Pontibacter diazotrophicus]RDV16037.1 DUF4168 domain-containing protein [Pontibacter diazotrophicus]
MVLIKKGTIAATLLVASMSFGHAAFAQQETTPQTETQQQDAQEFSDADLEKFVAANSQVTEIQNESREALVNAIEEQDLTLDRFNELAKAHQQQQLQETAENPEEIAAFSNAAQQVVKIQPEAKEKSDEAIKEHGLTVEQYEAIMQAYEQDPAVKAKVQQLVVSDQ